jgi:hypothetical protein
MLQDKPSPQMHTRSDMRFLFWLPKTAGGTLAAGIRSNPGILWPGSQIDPAELPAPSPSRQIWLGGHTNFGHHLIYNAEPIYLTVFRDPIERLISEFFYHHQHDLPGIFIPKNEMVPAFVRYIEASPHLNYYSYMFSDYCVQKEITEEGLPPWDGNPIDGFNLIIRRIERYGFLAENVPFKRINVDDAFRKALKNLEMMRFIGFFDRLHETATYLNREFGLKVALDTRVHRTTWMPSLNDLPSHLISMLVRKTQADYEFINKAKRAPASVRSRLGRIWQSLTSARS